MLYTYELTKLSVLVYESGTPFPILQRVCCSPERTRLLSGRVWTWAQSLPKANTLHRHAVEHRCGAPLWSTTLEHHSALVCDARATAMNQIQALSAWCLQPGGIWDGTY